ncbi:MAG TPA: hydrogenase maturation protease [Thermosulfurimonas dismutans]|uniref:Hydrogenase maturation protease n=1 Tax=Thermosulfurimonas dismutans TaxID=999894 RepID=A0A7C3GED1_9BACT|nr:hydrogenase maturation protease [Thermosulfurimonas dismutans]
MRVLILGVGNLLLRDEGFGIHVIRELERCYEIPPEVEVVDGGCAGFSLLDYLREKDLALLVDIVADSAPPGTLQIFEDEDLSRFAAVKTLSPHEVSLIEALKFAEFSGLKPSRVRILAAVPEEISPGLELSPSLKKALPRALSWLEEELASVNIYLRRRRKCA